jgi:hypothetical protein
VDRISNLVPSAHSGDDFVGVGGPDEGLGLLIVLVEEPVDRGLKVCDGSEHTALEPSVGQDGKEAFYGIQPRSGRGRKVEGPSRMADEPFAHFGMLVGGVVVDDGVGRFSRGRLALDHIEEADKFLMPMRLHVASGHRAIEDVHRGEQRRRSVPDVVVGHGPGAALLQRQAGAECGRAPESGSFHRATRRWRARADRDRARPRLAIFR